MIRKPRAVLSLLTIALLLGVGVGTAEELQTSPLPKPRMEGGKPLLQALKERKSARDFKDQALPPQLLADLLWAGFGINRPENDHRTAPSAMNSQEIDLYVVTAEGVYVYEAKSNQLRQVMKGDLREKTGKQAFVKVAPVSLVFVADFTRQTKAKPEDKERYAGIDTGFIGQNIYLFCASEGLSCVVHDLDRPALAEALQLRPDQKIILAQTVGFPK